MLHMGVLMVIIKKLHNGKIHIRTHIECADKFAGTFFTLRKNIESNGLIF